MSACLTVSISYRQTNTLTATEAIWMCTLVCVSETVHEQNPKSEISSLMLVGWSVTVVQGTVNSNIKVCYTQARKQARKDSGI